MATPLTAPILAWLGRLSHPWLFVIVALLFLVNLVLPDPIPFIDELLLGLGAVLLANLKERRRGGRRPPIDGTPPS